MGKWSREELERAHEHYKQAAATAGNLQFSSEEDAYNPASFAPVVKAWIAAKRAAGG